MGPGRRWCLADGESRGGLTEIIVLSSLGLQHVGPIERLRIGFKVVDELVVVSVDSGVFSEVLGE